MKQYTAMKREEFISSVLLRSGAIASDAGVVSNPTELAKIAIGEAYDRMFDSSALTIINDKISRLEKLGKLTETGKEILRELNGLKSEIQQFPQFTADQLEVIAGNQINTTSVPYEHGFIKGFVNGGLFVQGLPEPSKQEPQQEQVMSGEALSEFIRNYVDIDSLDEAYIIGIEELTKAALTHPSPAPQQEVKELHEWIAIFYGALKDLVDLKDYKDKMGKDRIYTESQPMTWHKAKQSIELWAKSDYGAKGAPQQEVSPELEAQPSPTHKYQTGKVWAISESTPEGLSIEGNHNWKEGQLLSEGEDFYKAENYFTKKGHPTSFNSDHHEYSEEVAIPLLQPSPTVQEDRLKVIVREIELEASHDKEKRNSWYIKGLEKAVRIIKAVQASIPSQPSTEHKKEGGGQ
jgi:hypothetical protein